MARTINIGTGTGIDTIKIGTGGTGADDIDIGDALADVDVTGASQIVAGTGDALTLTANAASTWSTSAGLLTITGAGGVTIDTASGNAININAVGANLNLKTTTSGDIILDPASGTITLSNGDVIKTITGGPASRPVGEQILREVIPIFGFDLPARTASTTYVTVSRTIENYPFSSYLSGTTRVHKFIIRYANASATETTTWQVWNVTSGAQTSSFTVPASPGTSLDTGTVYITSAVIIPTNTDDWRVDVKVAAGDTIQIFEILLAAYDQVD